MSVVTIEDRFWSKVDNSAGPDGCWLWTANRAVRGYGRIGWGGHRVVLAHRVSYELATGEAPGRMCVLHSCDNPPCVNPAHLFLGTQADNMRDKAEKGRARPGSQNPNAKITEADVLEIRRLRAEGVPGNEVAERFGLKRATVYSICAGRMWKHVGAEPSGATP
jgi:hypothetical protein